MTDNWIAVELQQRQGKGCELLHSLLLTQPVVGQVQRHQVAVVLQLLNVSSTLQLVACML